jgi:hypothetical protein
LLRLKNFEKPIRAYSLDPHPTHSRSEVLDGNVALPEGVRARAARLLHSASP